MMYLEVFDKQSELLVQGYRLRGIDLADLKRLLDVDPDAEQYGCDVPLSRLPDLMKYVDEAFDVDPSYTYQIDFYRA